MADSGPPSGASLTAVATVVVPTLPLTHLSSGLKGLQEDLGVISLPYPVQRHRQWMGDGDAVATSATANHMRLQFCQVLLLHHSLIIVHCHHVICSSHVIKWKHCPCLFSTLIAMTHTTCSLFIVFWLGTQACSFPAAL